MSGERLDASGRRISWGGMVKRSRGDTPVAAAAPAPPSLRLTLTLRQLTFAALDSVPCCVLAPPMVVSLVGEAPVVFGLQTSNLSEAGF